MSAMKKVLCSLKKVYFCNLSCHEIKEESLFQLFHQMRKLIKVVQQITERCLSIRDDAFLASIKTRNFCKKKKNFCKIDFCCHSVFWQQKSFRNLFFCSLNFLRKRNRETIPKITFSFKIHLIIFVFIPNLKKQTILNNVLRKTCKTSTTFSNVKKNLLDNLV